MNTLLTLALALLVAAQQPHVPQDMKNTAIHIANLAIQMSLQQPVGTIPTNPSVQPEIAESASCSVTWDVTSDAVQDGIKLDGSSVEFIVKTQRCEQTLTLDAFQSEGDIWMENIVVNKDYTSVRMSPGHVIEDGYWKPVFRMNGETKTLTIKTI